MIWDDKGFLVSKNKYNENSLIVEIFTEIHGKTPGIIFGGTSKKIKNYLQLGNLLHISYQSKTDEKLGYFKIEILNAFSPLFFNNHHKLLCISSAMQLIKILTADSQKNLKVYELIHKFYDILKSNYWIKEYIFWELELLSILGYNLDLKNFVEKDIINGQTKYKIKSSKETRFIPGFLMDNNLGNPNNESLLQGLKLVGDYLEKNILKPNNINYNLNRSEFVNALK